MKNSINIIGPMDLKKANIDTSLFTIIIDGGLNHQLELLNCISLGDQDSSKYELDKIIPREKDYSDLSYGLQHIPKKTEVINCYGLLGGRLDHQLCVIGDIIEFLQTSSMSFNLYSSNVKAVILISPGKWQINHIGTFSVLSLNEQKVHLDGEIKYKSTGEYTYIKPLSSRSLSNESTGLIQINNEFPLGVYLNHY